MKGSKKQQRASAASAPGVDFGQIERLLAFMTEHGLEEFEYAQADFRIRLKKAMSHASGGEGRSFAPPQQFVQSGASPSQPQAVQAVPVAPAQVAPPPPPAEELHVIKSPIVGTFYAAPNPDSPPFVKVGDSIQTGKTVCIIEAMKLMNEIEAEISGEVVRVIVENGHPVEYGEPLFEIRPAKKK